MESLKLTQKTTPVKQEVELTFDEVLNLKSLIKNTSYSLPSNHSPMCFLQTYPPYNKIDIIEDKISSLESNYYSLKEQMGAKADKSEFRWPKWPTWNWNNHPALVVFIAWVFIFGLNYCSVHCC